MKNEREIKRTGAMVTAIVFALIGLLADTQRAQAQWTQNGNNDVFKTNTAGNVGIGTTGPGAKLEVNTTTNADGIKLNDGTIASKWIVDTGSVAHAIGTVTNHPFYLMSNGSAKVWIAAAGNVGIGTTSPAANLDVTKNQNATTNIAINNSDTNANSRAQLNLTSGSVAARLLTIHNDSLYLGTTTSSGLNFQTAATNAMTIDANQRVGIGTTSPSSLLHVLKSVSNAAIVQVRNQNTTAGTSFGMFVAAGTNSSDYVLALRDAGDNDLVRVLGNGNFGIGTISPSQKLEVVGGIKASGFFWPTGGQAILSPDGNTVLMNT